MNGTYLADCLLSAKGGRNTFFILAASYSILINSINFFIYMMLHTKKNLLLLTHMMLYHQGFASWMKSSASSTFNNLATFLSDSQDEPVSVVVLKTLSKSQATLKKIDGTSYEFYQRSHNKEINKSVTGRAERTAGRVGACADALFACELLDLAFDYQQNDGKEDQYAQRNVILNTTISDPLPINVVVIFEQNYRGAAGVNHGGINGLTSQSKLDNHHSPITEKPRGRYLIILNDLNEDDMVQSLQILDNVPSFFQLSLGLVSDEIACVNSLMWKTAAALLNVLQSKNIFKKVPNNDNVCELEQKFAQNKDGENRENFNMLQPAIHLVGRSLAGGVAALASIMLDGTIPYPKTAAKQRKRKRRKLGKNQSSESSKDQADLKETLHGVGKLRTSCVTLGAPPSISANIGASYITSIIHGDDIICRSTRDSLDRLRHRVNRLQEGNILTKQVGWMTDAISLTVSSLQSHAHGSEGEEGKLSIPGKAYLIRPRRMKGGVSSVHEIGNRGGREALRGAMLWQLNDILLSNSMWEHHSLESYIYGLNRVELRKFTDSEVEEDEF